MTREVAFVAEAVLVTLAKAFLVLSCVYFVVAGVYVFRRYREGRGAESIWPDEADEPQTADAPASSDLRGSLQQRQEGR